MQISKNFLQNFSSRRKIVLKEGFLLLAGHPVPFLVPMPIA